MVPLIHIIISLLLPIIAIIMLEKQKPIKHAYAYSVLSFLSCGLGITAQLSTIKQRLLSSDIGGIEDTIQAVIVFSAGFLIVTVLVNLFMLGLYYEKE